MSEAKRYVAIGGMMPVDEGCGEGVYVRDEDFRVLKSELETNRKDFDRVTAECDAALGREVALQKRSAAAEAQSKRWMGIASEATCRAAGLNERADLLEGLLREAIGQVRGVVGNCDDELADRIDAALKPTEPVESIQCIDQQGSKVKVGVAYQVSFAFKEVTCVVVEAINEDGSVNCYDVHFKMKVENVHPGTLWRPLKHTWEMWPADVDRVTEYVGAQALDLTP